MLSVKKEPLLLQRFFFYFFIIFDCSKSGDFAELVILGFTDTKDQTYYNCSGFGLYLGYSLATLFARVVLLNLCLNKIY